MSDASQGMTFWDHLDELRGVIVRALLVTTVAAVGAFCMKEPLIKSFWRASKIIRKSAKNPLFTVLRETEKPWKNIWKWDFI